MRPRVLTITTSTGAAGAERIVSSLARGLMDEFDVELLYLTGEEAALDEGLESAGLSVTRLRGRCRRPFDMLRRVREHIAGRRPAIVHSHLYHANVLAAKALRGDRETSLIHTEHIIERRFRPFRPMLARRAAARATCIVGVSGAVAEHLRANRFQYEKAMASRNGIELSRFAGAAEVNEEPVIGAVGRLDRQKGFDLLLQIFAEVVAVVPGARLVIAGDGPQGPRLRSEAERRYGDRVEFLGFQEDVAAVMERARVIAFPSRFEGFGLVLAEAGAARRPVVAFDLPPTREIVVDGKTGRIASDPAAFAQGLVEMLQNPESARRMGDAGRERVEREFGVERMVAEFRELYRSVLG